MTQQIRNRRRKARETYFLNLKENASFLVGLGGSLVALIIFHYSVFKIRETEYFKVNSDLLNESILVDGIRSFLSWIIFIVMVISLFVFVTYYPRKQLSDMKVELEEKEFGRRTIITASLILLSILGIFIWSFRSGYHGDLPDTKYAFILLSVLIILHIVIAVVNFFLTKRTESNKTIIDVPVMMQMVYVAFMILFLLLPYSFLDKEIMGQGSIIVTTDNQFMLVEKNQNTVLLREMRERNSENKNEYYLTDNYIQMAAEKVVFKDQPIFETINYEKKGYLKFEVVGKN